ncbi:MAG: ATP-binding cassette domain-containing protein, partial [archaeon]|nr:ATP-binding cassette domain-containing protein [archaeon]
MSAYNFPILEVLNLWKSYDGHQAVIGLDLDVKKGEIFGLLGPNGAGKTTTLKIIVGLIKMDKGIVKIDRVDISEEQYGYKKQIGYLPENPTLPEYLTAEEF